MKNTIVGIFVVIAAGLVAGTAIYSVKWSPSMTNLVNQKTQDIKTPSPPIGNLTPVRDLRGTWNSSLKGKGLQLYGKFVTGPSTTQVYENGDINLIINSMEGNTASGTVRYTNLCSWGGTAVPGYGTVSVPKNCMKDSGASPIQIRVSGSRLDFGTINAGGGSYTMQGNYTTDIISGTMTANIPPYGGIKGEFHLIRAK